MPIPRAVAVLAIPTIISQIVTMIYNLADTFFVGQIGNPYMVAAVSLVSPWFNLLTALGNLFGLGGGSLISRMLGRKDHDSVRYVSAFSVWGGAAVTLCFSAFSFLMRGPLLHFLGASSNTYGYAENYLNWVVVLGGILNVVLDPIMIFGFHLDVAGAVFLRKTKRSWDGCLRKTEQIYKGPRWIWQ